MEDVAGRETAFQNLLRDVGQQLGQNDITTIEFYEKVPPKMKGQDGLMLLDFLLRNGKFSLWKTQPLREILRRACRFDLADDTVKKYQMKFQDKDSPTIRHRQRGKSMPVTGSPRLFPSHARPRTAATTSSPKWTPGHRRTQSELPSLQSKESVTTSEPKHTLAEPHQEVGPNGPSMPSMSQSMHPFSTPSPSEPTNPAECRGNGSRKRSTSMGKGSNTGILEPISTTYESQSLSEVSASCPDVSATGDPNHELGMKAIAAVVDIVHATMSSSRNEVSCLASSYSSLPSYEPQISQTSLQSTSRTSLHSTSQVTAHGKQLPAHRSSFSSQERKLSTLLQSCSTPTQSSAMEPEPSQHPRAMSPDNIPGNKESCLDTSASSLNPQTSSPTKKPEEHSHEHTELLSELPTAPPTVTSTPKGSDDPQPDEPAKDQQRPISAKARIKSFLKLSRPLAAQRTPPLSSYQWKVKRDDMVKLVSKHSHAKVQSISCPCPLELDVSNPKHNPKLSLKLYPYGLFEDEGKSVSLQMNVATHKKSPPISPSLQMRFAVTVLDDQGKTLRQWSTLQSLTTSVFYVFSLLTHDELIKGLQGECVELRASVQIEQQSV